MTASRALRGRGVRSSLIDRRMLTCMRTCMRTWLSEARPLLTPLPALRLLMPLPTLRLLTPLPTLRRCAARYVTILSRG